MIGRLRGILLEKKPPQLLIEAAGIGYELLAPMPTCFRLPELGKEVCLHVHMVVREDAHTLYGFLHLQERSLFRALLKVSGVGPKLALTILSGMEPDAFVRCVLDNDAARLVRVPGIGKKTAERLIIEMRDRLEDWHTAEIFPETSLNSPNTSNGVMQEAINALVALGYKPQEASRVIAQIDKPDASSEELIRLALRSSLREPANVK
jgi:Holliday junction DNA helicase RuvA